MKKCPFCGYGNDDQVETCQKCHAELPHETKKTEPEKARKKTRSELTYGS